MKTALALLLLPCLAHADPMPTATEIFDLRTKCGELARKRFEADSMGPISDVSLRNGASLSYRANYNLRTGRCYYEFTVFWAKREWSISSLHDLQGGSEDIALVRGSGSSGTVLLGKLCYGQAEPGESGLGVVLRSCGHGEHVHRLVANTMACKIKTLEIAT